MDRLTNINGYKTVDSFVFAKLERYAKMPHTFASLFEMMFSERENIMYEKSVGYRIEKTTYGESHDRILHKASALRTILPDLQRNDTVALYMENSLEWIETMWAVLCAGFRVILFNMRLDRAILERTVTDMNVRAVISDKMPFSVTTVSSADLVPAEESVPVGAFGTEIMVMSSGTSGHAKVCAYDAEAFYQLVNDSYSVVRESEQIKKHYDGELKLLTFLPFYHIFGLIAVYIWFGFFSRTFVHLADMNPSTILNTVRRHKVTHIFAVPLFWNKVYEQAVRTIRERGDATWKKFHKGLAVAQKLESIPALHDAFCTSAFREIRENMFGESVLFMITGGSEVKPEVMRFFNSVGYHLANGYGMTEIGITSVELSSDKKVLISGSVGHPMTSVEYQLAENGELQVRGKATCCYIVEGGVRTDNTDWYNTHDLAVCRNGRWYVLGRQDDVVISPTGENLNPNLIEPGFTAIEGISEACLCGVKENGAVVPTLIISTESAVLLRENGFETVKDAVIRHIAEVGLEGQIARTVYTERPLVASGDIKLNRRAVRERYGKGEYTEIGARNTSKADVDTAVSEAIKRIFAEALSRPISEITDGFDFFADGGGTSLDYFAMLPQFEKVFSVTVPVSVSADGKSLTRVSEFYDYIKGVQQV